MEIGEPFLEPDTGAADYRYRDQMATNDDVAAAHTEALLHTLQKVKEAADADVALNWAEAYAWLTAAAQAHGGRTGR